MTVNDNKAPSASSRNPVWATAQKDCVGTALGNAKLWFTLGRGIVTEVFYPRIDIPQIRDLGFIIADDKGFWQELKALPGSKVELEDPRVPLPTVRHHHDRFDFVFRVCADPDRDVLLIDFVLTGDASLRPYLLCAARLGESTGDNEAWVGLWEARKVLWAEQGPFGLALTCRSPEGYSALGACTVGEIGASDIWQDFSRHGRMTWEYSEAGPGEVALGGALPRCGTLALALGSSKEAAATNAWSSLSEGFKACVEEYATRWCDWHKAHKAAEDLVQKLSPAVRTLYTRSANVLKVHEDRTFPGALVASLSVPWGEASDSLGGYHLVWSRDLVEGAGALVAIGAYQEARQILTYLISTQQADGHWLQNQWLGGKPFWQGVQLDETGFPILLAASLAAHGELRDIAVKDMMVRALQFIVREGPVTRQDRWEEDSGVNAFTLAVVIAALVEGAAFLDGRSRDCALMLADYWNSRMEAWTFAEGTTLSRQFGVSGHYIRIAPPNVLDDDNAAQEIIAIKNRADDPRLAACNQVSNDFLQLVRYGLRAADDPRIVSSVIVMDGVLKTDTPSGPVWHRYNGDGYGEHADGRPFDGAGIGRGWPLLVGERGHYALSAGKDPQPYLEAMTAMTGKGGLLPEQVWDSAPIPEYDLIPGKPSGSAMPLVWAHGEFIKLCHSSVLGYPVDRPLETWKRYQGLRPVLDYRLWQLRQRPRQILEGEELRVVLQAPFTLHWGRNGWQDAQDIVSVDWGLAHVVILPVRTMPAAHTIQFTVRWLQGDWLGEDFHIDIIGGTS